MAVLDHHPVPHVCAPQQRLLQLLAHALPHGDVLEVSVRVVLHRVLVDVGGGRPVLVVDYQQRGVGVGEHRALRDVHGPHVQKVAALQHVVRKAAHGVGQHGGHQRSKEQHPLETVQPAAVPPGRQLGVQRGVGHEPFPLLR
eukprot:3232926-Pyramimonas_sp.AAC.2